MAGLIGPPPIDVRVCEQYRNDLTPERSGFGRCAPRLGRGRAAASRVIRLSSRRHG